MKRWISGPVLVLGWAALAHSGGLLAGASKIDVGEPAAEGRPDRPQVKALVLSDGSRTAAIITVDAVALGSIGPIRDDYLVKVRAALSKECGIDPARVIINASHCHATVRPDVDAKTVEAVKQALSSLAPVKVGVGRGEERRISENRRVTLKDGREADVRHAYALPADEEVVGFGPIDPEIGVLRLDRLDGSPLALVYNFACHPIQGVPGGGSTADLVGFASSVVEENLGGDAVALFLQGCAGDINPVFYKDVNHPRDAEPLGQRLGLAVLRAARGIRTKVDDRLVVLGRTIRLPGADTAARIEALEREKNRLVDALSGTSLNFKTFLPLAVRYGLDPRNPSAPSHAYASEAAAGAEGLKSMDEENRKNMAAYVENVRIMEELTRVKTNLALLKMHRKRSEASVAKDVAVELTAWRVGDFTLTTFPGELTVRIGLDLKRKAGRPHVYVAGYTNGYIYYAATDEQLRNSGAAQEDCDTRLAPGWRSIYEAAALELLGKL